MANYQEVRVKLTNTQLKKIKIERKNKTGILLRINNKNFQDEKFPNELFLTTRQTAKTRNAIAKNMSTDIKLSEAQLPKMIQSGGFLRNMLGNLGKKIITDLANPLARDNLPVLLSNLASNTINKFKRKVNGKGTVRAGKGFALFISNEDMNVIIKIIKSLEDLGVLIDGVTKAVKHEAEIKEGGFLGALLAPLAVSLVQSVISSIVKGISGRGT